MSARTRRLRPPLSWAMREAWASAIQREADARQSTVVHNSSEHLGGRGRKFQAQAGLHGEFKVSVEDRVKNQKTTVNDKGRAHISSCATARPSAFPGENPARLPAQDRAVCSLLAPSQHGPRLHSSRAFPFPSPLSCSSKGSSTLQFSYSPVPRVSRAHLDQGCTHSSWRVPCSDRPAGPCAQAFLLLFS